MNFYQRFLGDYMRDTMHLSVMEHGAYGLMLDTYYATERPLPADHESLFRICRAMNKAEQEAVRRVADQFFPIHEDGMRHNRRADYEIATAQPKIKAAKENGKKGGRPANPTRTDYKPTGIPTGLELVNPTGTQLQSSPEPEPHPTPQPEPPPVSAAQSATPGSVCFSRYADAYRLRYHEDPVRNKKTNSLFKQLVERLGHEEAPEVSEFYVWHNNSQYVLSGHAVGLLIRDCEKIRTEWKTGKRITQTSAKQADRKETNLSIAEQLIAEERRKRV